VSNPAATRLAQLHRDCAPMLHYYALRLTGGDVHRAEEAVQEAFSWAWRRAGSFDPGDPAARAWLVTTVRNVLIDESRSGWVRKRTDDSTLAERESPLDDIDRMLTGTLLAEALASLSEGHMIGPGSREPDRCTDTAAYVLGMLDPADRTSFLEHAEACLRCRSEIGELAGLLPVLVTGAADRTATSPTPAAPASPTPPARRGVPISWIAASAVLAAVLALVLFGVGVLRSTATPATVADGSTAASTARPVVSTPAASGAGAPRSTAVAALVRSFPGLGTAAVEIAVRRTDSGSSLSIRCTGAVEHDPTSATPGMVSLWVWTHSGRQLEVTAWTDMHATTTIDSATSVIPEDMSMLELRGPDGHSLSQVNI